MGKIVMGLTIGLGIYWLFAVDKYKDKLTVDEVDLMLYRYGHSPIERIHFKNLLLQKGLLEQGVVR